MRVFYFSLITLLLVIPSGFGQELQNATWVFGNHSGLTFTGTNPPSAIINAPGYFNESCAAVSDSSGNLLFYTNGVSVWDSTGNVLTNGTGLQSNISSTQGAVIIPRPGHGTHYLATISGVSGGQKGLYYSEVDMSTGEVVSTNKNTILKDHNGVDIDLSYNNMSEKLTSTRHSDGINYWLVAYIDNHVYSYLVTSSGISLNPVSSPAPVSVQSTDPEYGLGTGQMKISPNTQHIGVCYGDTDPFGAGEYGALALGEFNFNTGEVVFNDFIEIPGEIRFYGIEFSPNSQLVYFTTESNVFSENYARTSQTSQSQSYSNIYSFNLDKNIGKKNQLPKLIHSTPINQNLNNTKSATPISDLNIGRGLQLAINGKIYACIFEVNNLDMLSVINNPNNESNPDFVSFNTYVGGTISLTLPQWVYSQKFEICPEHITLSTPELSPNHTYKYSDYINTNSNYSITSGQIINLQAGNLVLLEPDTYIQSGAESSLYIAPCGQSIEDFISNESKVQNSTESVKSIKNEFVMYPNPSNDIVNLYYQKGIKTITVISIDGKAIYNTTANGDTEYILNVKNFSKGIYLINIESKEGEFFTKKLIVK